MTKAKKKVICFVDDDVDELGRFEQVFGADYIVVAKTTAKECRDALDLKGLKPALWVLDLYFPKEGQVPTKAQNAEMIDRFGKLEEHVRDFQAYLAKIEQGREGGLELLSYCRKHFKVPAIMFTRKGTLDDAVLSLNQKAAAVLKKPMPRPGVAVTKESLDEALRLGREELLDKFDRAIRENSFFVKHRAKVTFVCGVVLTLLAEDLWNLIKNSIGK